MSDDAQVLRYFDSLNEGMQATASSIRLCLAPASGGGSPRPLGHACSPTSDEFAFTAFRLPSRNPPLPSLAAPNALMFLHTFESWRPLPQPMVDDGIDLYRAKACRVQAVSGPTMFDEIWQIGNLNSPAVHQLIAGTPHLPMRLVAIWLTLHSGSSPESYPCRGPDRPVDTPSAPLGRTRSPHPIGARER
jgi:hypothetical protein